MQRLEVSGAVRPIYGSLAVKRLSNVEDVAVAYRYYSKLFKSHIFRYNLPCKAFIIIRIIETHFPSTYNIIQNSF